MKKKIEKPDCYLKTEKYSKYTCEFCEFRIDCKTHYKINKEYGVYI